MEIYNTIVQAGVGSNNTITLPSESGTLALVHYKVHTALLTQTGTSAPVATVLESTWGLHLFGRIQQLVVREQIMY
jgi:hypothetical protein